MFHHDNRDYQAAATEAAQKGRVKLEEIIHKGISAAQATIERIENRVITDQIARTASVLAVPVEEKGQPFALQLPDGTRRVVHPNAARQILSDAGVPMRYAEELAEQANGTPWGAELVAHNINTIFSHRNGQRNLLRSEGNQLMGFLSDKYRRIDSRPLLESFVGAAHGIGLVPVDGVASDTKVRVRALLPKVFEPVPNEVMAFGVEWGNSDYGDGGNVVNLFMLRVWCTNLAISTQFLRQIHLGKRLDDNIEYSQRTYELDTRANASAVADMVRTAIGPKSVNGVLDTIKNASEEELKSREGIEKKLKALSKTDRERVLEAFDGPDVQNLPPGKTLWRLSNAASWIAQHADNGPDRKLELQKLAGDLIPTKSTFAPLAV